MRSRPVFSVLIISFLAILLGCGRSASVSTPEGGEATVTAAGDKVDVTVTGPKGEKETVSIAPSGGELPADFPKDVPIPKGAKPTGTIKTGKLLQVPLETDQSVSDVVAFYTTALPKNGWEVQGSFQMADASTIGATKQARTLSVTVSKRDAATMIILTVSQ